LSDYFVNLQNPSQAVPLGAASEESNWYAVHTMARHEKQVAQYFRENTIITFLPLVHQIRHWSDRRSRLEIPLLSCYAFVRIAQTTVERLKVLRTPGVLGFVGSERVGTPIPEVQIETLRTAINEKIPCGVHPYISVGNRVRVRGGSLDGIEGILVRHNGLQSLVLSVTLLQRSVVFCLEGYDIESV